MLQFHWSRFNSWKRQWHLSIGPTTYFVHSVFHHHSLDLFVCLLPNERWTNTPLTCLFVFFQMSVGGIHQRRSAIKFGERFLVHTGCRIRTFRQNAQSLTDNLNDLQTYSYRYVQTYTRGCSYVKPTVKYIFLNTFGCSDKLFNISVKRRNKSSFIQSRLKDDHLSSTWMKVDESGWKMRRSVSVGMVIANFGFK